MFPHFCKLIITLDVVSQIYFIICRRNQCLLLKQKLHEKCIRMHIKNLGSAYVTAYGERKIITHNYLK